MASDDEPNPQWERTYEKIWERRAIELQQAKAHAHPDKEPFDRAAVEQLISLSNPYAVAGQQTAEDRDRRFREAEYEYYVRKPSILTLREFAELLELRDLYS